MVSFGILSHFKHHRSGKKCISNYIYLSLSPCDCCLYALSKDHYNLWLSVCLSVDNAWGCLCVYNSREKWVDLYSIIYKRNIQLPYKTWYSVSFHPELQTARKLFAPSFNITVNKYATNQIAPVNIVISKSYTECCHNIPPPPSQAPQPLLNFCNITNRTVSFQNL